ncbi:MAG: hypothetical protein LBD23_04355 [Oscillospiraceae bacterium]|jgi:hypothetical protein|nr:hypothetical protein [Oscillospiraceae bacterium]
MSVLYATNGRVLTLPKQLKPILKDVDPVFFELLGYIRFFYVADEIWDEKASLIFKTDNDILADVNDTL